MAPTPIERLRKRFNRTQNLYWPAAIALLLLEFEFLTDFTRAKLHPPASEFGFVATLANQRFSGQQVVILGVLLSCLLVAAIPLALAQGAADDGVHAAPAPWHRRVVMVSGAMTGAALWVAVPSIALPSAWQHAEGVALQLLLAGLALLTMGTIDAQWESYVAQHQESLHRGLQRAREVRRQVVLRREGRHGVPGRRSVPATIKSVVGWQVFVLGAAALLTAVFVDREWSAFCFQVFVAIDFLWVLCVAIAGVAWVQGRLLGEGIGRVMQAAALVTLGIPIVGTAVLLRQPLPHSLSITLVAPGVCQVLPFVIGRLVKRWPRLSVVSLVPHNSVDDWLELAASVQIASRIEQLRALRVTS